MNKVSKQKNHPTPLTDHRLAAGATLHGGRLVNVTQDPASGRLTFYFEGLPPNFVQDTFNGELTVNLRDFISALDHIMGLIHQFKARRER